MSNIPKQSGSKTRKEAKSSSISEKMGFKKAESNKTESTIPRTKKAGFNQIDEPKDIRKKGIYFTKTSYHGILLAAERLEMVNILKNIINASDQGSGRDNNKIFEQILKHPELSKMDPHLLKIMANALLKDSRLLKMDSNILEQMMNRKPQELENILNVLSKFPKLLEQKSDNLEPILDSSNAVYILKVIGSYPKLLEHIDKVIYLHRAINFFSMLNAASLLEEMGIGEHSEELLKHIDKIISLHEATNFLSLNAAINTLMGIGLSPGLLDHMDKIIQLHKATNFLSMSNAVFLILKALGSSPGLVEHTDKIIHLHKATNFLSMPNAHEILMAIGRQPNILELELEFVNEIIPLASSANILTAIAKNPKMLDLRPFFVKRILRFPNAANILGAVAEHLGILNLDTHFVNQVIPLDDAGNILIAIAKHPEILELKPDFVSKVLRFPNAGKILDAAAEHLEILNLLKPDFMNIIITSANASEILSAIAKRPEILELKSDFVKEVLPLPNAGKILDAVTERLEILELMTPAFIDKILALPNADKILSAIAALPEILELTPNLMDRMLFGPNSSRILNVLKTFSEGLQQADLLIQYEKLYIIQYEKLYNKFNGQVGNNFESIVLPYLILRSEQRKSGAKKLFLNISRILKDPSADKWNNFPMREGNINDEDWKKLRADLETKMKQYFPGNQHIEKLENALRWFDQIPNTRDAQIALQLIRKRVASIIDYIKNQKEIDPRILGSDSIVDEGVEIAKELVRILAEGGSGTRCPDAAAETLEEAELFALAFGAEKGDFVINIIVNLWKRNIIPTKFVDPTKLESVEMQLAYLKLLNLPLGLESKMMDMLHEGIGGAKPLDEVMKIVYNVLNEEGLIGFAIDHPLMQAQFKTDPKALEAFNQLLAWDLAPLLLESEKQKGLNEETNLDNYIKTLQDLMVKAPSVEALEILKQWVDTSYYTVRDEVFENYPQKAAVLERLVTIQLEKMISNFKTEKTKMLLQEAGFLSDTVNYEEPAEAYWKQ